MASIQKRPDGRWRARYRDETGREHAKHFTRKIDGQKWLDEVTASIVTGSYVDPRAGKITLQSFFDEWATRQIWTSGTSRAMVLSVKCTTFADIELSKIRPSHVETWVKKLDSDGLAPNTIRTRFINVRSVFRGAIRDRLIGVDPSLNVRLPRLRKAEAAMRIPTTGEVGRIMAAADPWFQPLIGLCAFGGLRLGEALAVQLKDIDFLRRTLQVSRQVQRPIGLPPEIRAPKYGSERQIHLPEALVNMLARHVEEYGVGGESEWIFPRADNLPAPANTISQWWRNIMEAEDLVGLRQHDLRHFYASGLIASGCDVVTVQRAMGHATASTTLNTYSHLWPTAEDRTRAAAADLMRESLGPSADSGRTAVAT